MPYYVPWCVLLLGLRWSGLAQATAAPVSQPLTYTQMAKMAKVLRLEGYPCTKPGEGFFEGVLPQGMAFKLVCESDTYQVIIRPDATWLINTRAKQVQ